MTDKPPSPDIPLPAVRSGARLVWSYARAIALDHGFWNQFMAAKGGLAAIALALATVVTTALALPFVAAAFAIAGCGALLGLGIFGLWRGGIGVLHALRALWREASGQPPPPPEAQAAAQDPLPDRLAASKAGTAIRHTALWQRFRNSKSGQALRAIVHMQDVVLSSLASGGSLMTLTAGFILLVTHVLMAPVIVMGSALALVVAAALGTIAAGIVGLGFSLKFMKDSLRALRLRFAHDRKHQARAERKARRNSPPRGKA